MTARDIGAKVKLQESPSRAGGLPNFNYIEDANLNGIYDSGDLYDWENYNTPTLNSPTRIINDFEDWNCKRHTNVVGNHSVDWANPGMQHNTKDNYND